MPTDRRTAQALYRKLQRLCREVEQQPGELSLLLGRPPRWYDPRHGSIVRAPLGRRPFVDNAIHELSGGCTEFAYFSGGSSASRAVRRHRELTDAIGSNYVEEASALFSRLRLAREAKANVAAFVGAQSDSKADPETHLEVSRLPLTSDGSNKAASVGDWLVAHPVSCISQPIFDRAIILLDSVEKAPDSVRGVVMNKPLYSTLRQLILRWPQAEDRAWAESLGPLLDLELAGGGPVVLESLNESMTWLHRHGAEVPGSREVAPSLWVGGCLTTLSAKVAAITGKADFSSSEDAPGSNHVGKRAAAAGVWPFLGFSGWTSLQLYNELERGVWLRVRASTPNLGRLCFDSGSSELADPNRAWQTVMSSVGLRHLADVPRNGVADQRLMQYLQAHHENVSSSEEDISLGQANADVTAKSSLDSQESPRRPPTRAKSSARRRR